MDKGFELQFQEFKPFHPIFWAFNLNFEKKNTLTIKIFTPNTIHHFTFELIQFKFKLFFVKFKLIYVEFKLIQLNSN